MTSFQVRETLEALAHPWLLRLIGLGRYQKRVILSISDFLVLGLALWLAMSVRLGELYVTPSWELFLVFCAAPAIGVATFFQLGLYRLVTRYISGQGAVLIPVAVGLSALFWALLVLLSGVQTSGAQSQAGRVCWSCPARSSSSIRSWARPSCGARARWRACCSGVGVELPAARTARGSATC